MIALGASSSLQGVTTNATTVTATITGALMSAASPPVVSSYEVLGQAQLASSAGSLFATDSSHTALISSIHLNNTGATVQTVTLYIGGTAASNEIFGCQIPAGGTVIYEDGAGWGVYTSTGLQVATGWGQGVGTPATSAQSLSVAANLLAGSSIALATNQLIVGSRFRWVCELTKTGAGVAAWTVAVKFGTLNTTSDGAIATWTSGTNTALIDTALLTIEMVVASLGASATANCIAFYGQSQGAAATGLGSLAAAPSPTATFNSAATSPFLHLDVTPGASAVMTGWCSAERLV